MLNVQERPMKAKPKSTCKPSHADQHVTQASYLPEVKSNQGTITYPRAVRKFQIEEQVALHQSVTHKPLTMRQIARRVKMTPGGHLMDILWEMAEEQRLIADPRPYRENMTSWDFKLPPDRVSSVLERIYEVKR